MKMIEFKDKAGHLIKPGDIIVYGHALGRCAALQYGKALAIKYVDRSRYDSKTSKLEDVKYAHLTVQGCTERGPWDGDNTPVLLKKGVLQFGDRCLVLTRNQVPADVLKLLDSVGLP